MGLAGLDALGDYLDRLRDDDEERRQVVRDLLIGVTTFFRDPDAFEALKAEAIDAILAASGPDGAVRAWVAGSATGEEAYSLAILLLEALAARGGGPPVQVFATDVDEEAIRAARRGLYTDEDLGGVPSPLRERDFEPLEGGGYRVTAALRDAVSFAVHDVCGDPPFHRMHLVSCRNLLIYLRPDVQERVLRLFHFALRAGGVLLLGGSESPPLGGEWFRPISKKWRIYRRLEGRRAAPEPLARGRPPRVEPPWHNVPTGAIEPTAADVARRAILEAVVPPSVVVGGDDRPLYLHGELGPYLVLPRGEPRLDVLQMLRPHLAGPGPDRHPPLPSRGPGRGRRRRRRRRPGPDPRDRPPGRGRPPRRRRRAPELRADRPRGRGPGDRPAPGRRRRRRGPRLGRAPARAAGRPRGPPAHRRGAGDEQRGAARLARGGAVDERGAPVGQRGAGGDHRGAPLAERGPRPGQRRAEREGRAAGRGPRRPGQLLRQHEPGDGDGRRRADDPPLHAGGLVAAAARRPATSAGRWRTSPSTC